jgi:hypothetical protein
MADNMSMEYERSESRLLCAELVRITWKEPAGRGRKGTAILENISASGACLQLEKPVPVNSLIQIRLPKGYLKGSVRYCVYRDIGYFVGLQFDENCKWSRRMFQPEHMLDLQRLLSRAIRGAARRSKTPTVH